MPVAQLTSPPSVTSRRYTFSLDRIDALIEDYPDPKGAILPILQQVQDMFGYLPRPILDHISRKVLMPLTDIYGLATFYRRFRLKPCGRHVIRVCDGTNCHLKGGNRNIEAVEEALHLPPGETSADGDFTFEIVYCLGACAHGPVAVFDGSIQRHVSPNDVKAKIKTLQ
jgi:NADH-quinone oxidoreductase subunit E